jgi:uncharacterized protein (TIGR02996 family)
LDGGVRYGVTELADQVIARRTAWQKLRKAAILAYQVNEYAAEASRRIGVAEHQTARGACLVVQLATAALQASQDGENHGDWQDLRADTVGFVLDGYALGAALVGASSTGQAIASPGACTRFANQSCRAGAALLAGTLGPTARRLAEGAPWLPLVANGLAAGLLLHAKEHGTKHEAITALVPRVERAAAGPVTRAPAAPELMAAILAAPDDDEPRLVYADWLNERSDPLGEFIQIQCALGRSLGGAGGTYTRGKSKLPFGSREELEVREKALLRKHEGTWLAPIRMFIREWTFARGFPHRVVADAGRFFEGMDAFRGVPLLEAELTKFEAKLAPRVEKIAAHPSLRLISLRARAIKPRSLRLLAAPFFARIRELDLYYNRLAPEDYEHLATAPLPAIERLSLSSHDLTDEVLAVVSRAAWWKRLKDVDLSANPALSPAKIKAARRG